ncbi:MAG: hypothetical protein HQL67_06875 [Magnetococcales bacterium]|nr:hypothetical protein [Magnetococcales bacterium]
MIKVRRLSFIILLLLFFSLCIKQAQAESFMGSGMITRSDGMKGYFIVGAYNSREKCDTQLEKLFDHLLKSGNWFTNRLSGHVNPCLKQFDQSSYFHDLHVGLPVKHTMLFHPSLRVLIVSPQSKADAENELCADLKQVVEYGLKLQSECVPAKTSVERQVSPKPP